MVIDGRQQLDTSRRQIPHRLTAQNTGSADSSSDQVEPDVPHDSASMLVVKILVRRSRFRVP